MVRLFDGCSRMGFGGLLLLSSVILMSQPASGQVGAFTYQGRLLEGVNAATGIYDLQFTIYDSLAGEGATGGPLTNAATAVSNGLFTVMLDFGTGVFAGAPRWLEIGVRTNGSTGPYTLLDPRQPVTATPYAIYASTAAYAEVAASVTGGVESTNGSYAGAVSFGTGYSNSLNGSLGAYYSNGVLALPASLSAEGPGFIFYSGRSGVGLGSLWVYGDHGGNDVPEVILDSQATIGIRPGLDQVVRNGAIGDVQMGQSGGQSAWYLQYALGAVDDGLGTANRGHSQRLEFRGLATSSSGDGVATPGIVGFADGGTNVVYPNGVRDIFGRLRFYTVSPEYSATSKFTDMPGIWVGEMGTNSWNLRGKLIQERRTASIGTGSYALDFNQSMLVDLASGVTNVTFYTTNATGNPADYETRTFIIRGGGLSPALQWPAAWACLGASSPGSGPTNVPTGQLICLQLRSLGSGEANIIASAQVATDNTFSWDADATNFFTRAGITDPAQKAAVNGLVLELKAGNIWALYYGIYPFVGGTATSHRENLKSGEYQMIWTAATHSGNGVGFDGATAFGDTTYDISAAGVTNSAVTNSFHTFVYCQSGTNWFSSYPNACPIGAAGSSGRLGIIKLANQELAVQGFNCSSFSGSQLVLGDNDERGPMMATRTGGSAQAFYFRSLSTTDSTPSSGVPSSNIYVGSTSYDGQLAKPCTTTLAGASFGAGMSSAQWATCRAAWENFENALGRQAP